MKKEERTRYLPIFEGKKCVVYEHRKKFILKISDAYIGTYDIKEFNDVVDILKDEIDSLKSEVRTIGVTHG